MAVVTLFLLVFISLQIQSQKLTTEENELNSKTCGVHFLGTGQPVQRRLVKKSYGGREFGENEYLWTAVIVGNGKMMCSGVQISPRHILTAAHCVLDFDIDKRTDFCVMNQAYNIVSVLAKPEDRLVLIGGGKIRCDGVPCQINKTMYGARKIMSKEVGMCDLKDDLVLIELNRNIPESDSTPICMPKVGMQLNPVLYAGGIGSDSSSPITFDNPNGRQSRGQQVVALRYDAVDQSLHQILTKTFRKTILPGDSGGPLFQVNGEGRHILVGITSALNFTSLVSENVMNGFTDVRDNLDWICKYSGVCPVEEEL